MEAYNPEQRIIDAAFIDVPVTSRFVSVDRINNFVEQNLTTIKNQIQERWPNATFEDYKFSCSEFHCSQTPDGSLLSAIVEITLLPEVQRKVEQARLEYVRDYQQQAYP